MKVIIAVIVSLGLIILLPFGMIFVVALGILFITITILTWLFGDIPIYNPFAEKKSMQ